MFNKGDITTSVNGMMESPDLTVADIRNEGFFCKDQTEGFKANRKLYLEFDARHG